MTENACCLEITSKQHARFCIVFNFFGLLIPFIAFSFRRY